MLCYEFEDRLTDYLDGGLDVETHKNFAAHAMRCPVCHDLLSEVKNTLVACSASEAPPASAGLEARILMSVIVQENGKSTRRYQVLELENSRITYFPLNWTLVHYIDEKSPLFGMERTDFDGIGLEVMVMIKGYNETAAQSFHAKSSYSAEEIVWNAKFKLPYHFREDGVTVFVLDRIDDYELLPDRAKEN